MPDLPAVLVAGDLMAPSIPVAEENASPYQRIAIDLRAAIRCGALRVGDQLPTVANLAVRYDVAPSTAHRAIAESATSGEVQVSRGKRATVLPHSG